MYLLSNNKQINEKVIIEAMSAEDFNRYYFLDDKTGQVKSIYANKRLTNIEQQTNGRFIIPQITYYEKQKWMKDFIEDFGIFMMDDDDGDAEKVYARLLLVQDKKDFYEQSLKILREENWIWIDTWQNWTQHYLYEEMEYWLASLPIYIKEDLELFDDCPICQAMKEGKTSFEELKESFEKAKEQGTIIDGDTDYFKTY